MTNFYINRLKNNKRQEKGRPDPRVDDLFSDFYFSGDFNKNGSSHRKWLQNSIGTIGFEIEQKLRSEIRLPVLSVLSLVHGDVLTSTLSHSNF